MALRWVTRSDLGRNSPPAMAMDFHRIPRGWAKDLNSQRDSAWAIPRRSADHSFFDQVVSARRRDSVMERAAVVYRASPSSADPFDSRDFVPDFADSVVADYSSPAVDFVFVDPGFVAVRLVIVAAAVAAAALCLDPSCFAGFSAAVVAVVLGLASVFLSCFSLSPPTPAPPSCSDTALTPALHIVAH